LHAFRAHQARFKPFFERDHSAETQQRGTSVAGQPHRHHRLSARRLRATQALIIEAFGGLKGEIRLVRFPSMCN
jgi:hypothetical protein